jgi:hypothetical protein
VDTLAYLVLKSVVVVRPDTKISDEFTVVAETVSVSTAVDSNVPYTVAPIPVVSNFLTLSWYSSTEPSSLKIAESSPEFAWIRTSPLEVSLI